MEMSKEKGRGKDRWGEKKRGERTHTLPTPCDLWKQGERTHTLPATCALLSSFFYFCLSVWLLLLFQGTKLGIKNGGKSADHVGRWRGARVEMSKEKGRGKEGWRENKRGERIHTLSTPRDFRKQEERTHTLPATRALLSRFVCFFLSVSVFCSSSWGRNWGSRAGCRAGSESGVKSVQIKWGDGGGREWI